MPAFLLHGNDGDESRLLVHGASGFAMVIPGRPLLDSGQDGPPKYDAVVRLRDLPIEIGVRLDDLTSAMDPEALAKTLTLAYAKQRTAEVQHAAPLRDGLIAVGADACATCMYVVGNEQPPSMEYLSVTVRRHAAGIWALYQTVRYSLRDLTNIHWACTRSVLQNFQTWDGREPSLPEVWPESVFVEPGIKLELLPAAFEEAQAKARDIGVLTQDQENALLEVLIRFANDDFPPRLALHPVMLEMTRNHVAFAGDPATTQVLLRNFDAVKTLHDLRGWTWQCAWAISKRTSKLAKAQFENDTEALARDLRDAMDRYDDPDVVAQRERYEAEKEKRTQAMLADFYVQTGQREGDEPLDQAIGKMMRYLGARIDNEGAAAGATEPIRQPLPTLDSGARVQLELSAVPDGTRQLELRITAPNGKSSSTRTLARGSNRDLVLFLEAPMAPRLVVDAIAEIQGVN